MSKKVNIAVLVSGGGTNLQALIDGEKSGIIKKGTTVVSYPLNCEVHGFNPQDKKAAEVIKKVSDETGCPFISPDCTKAEIREDSINGLHFSYENLEIKTKMVGTFQVGNLLTAIETVKELREKGFTISDEAIEKGIYSFTIPARTEKISE